MPKRGRQVVTWHTLMGMLMAGHMVRLVVLEAMTGSTERPRLTTWPPRMALPGHPGHDEALWWV